MMQANCVRCGLKVKSNQNYIKARLSAATAIFHWSCFVALMKGQRQGPREDAARKPNSDARD